MQTCKKCNQTFQTHQKINGKIRNLGSRRYCLTCSPFKKHNTRRIHKASGSKHHVFNDDGDVIGKICTKCHKQKTLDNFYKQTKKGQHSYCKSCYVKVTLLNQRKVKEKCVEYKGGKCERCGYDKCVGALHFHHRDPSQKDFEISKRNSIRFTKNKELFLQEVDKCDLLCANCHAELHFTYPTFT